MARAPSPQARDRAARARRAAATPAGRASRRLQAEIEPARHPPQHLHGLAERTASSDGDGVVALASPTPLRRRLADVRRQETLIFEQSCRRKNGAEDHYA